MMSRGDLCLFMMQGYAEGAVTITATVVRLHPLPTVRCIPSSRRCIAFDEGCSWWEPRRGLRRITVDASIDERCTVDDGEDASHRRLGLADVTKTLEGGRERRTKSGSEVLGGGLH